MTIKQGTLKNRSYNTLTNLSKYKIQSSSKVLSTEFETSMIKLHIDKFYSKNNIQEGKKKTQPKTNKFHIYFSSVGESVGDKTS